MVLYLRENDCGASPTVAITPPVTPRGLQPPCRHSELLIFGDTVCMLALAERSKKPAFMSTCCRPSFVPCGERCSLLAEISKPTKPKGTDGGGHGGGCSSCPSLYSPFVVRLLHATGEGTACIGHDITFQCANFRDGVQTGDVF